MFANLYFFCCCCCCFRCSFSNFLFQLFIHSNAQDEKSFAASKMMCTEFKELCSTSSFSTLTHIFCFLRLFCLVTLIFNEVCAHWQHKNNIYFVHFCRPANTAGTAAQVHCVFLPLFSIYLSYADKKKNCLYILICSSQRALLECSFRKLLNN